MERGVKISRSSTSVLAEISTYRARNGINTASDNSIYKD